MSEKDIFDLECSDDISISCLKQLRGKGKYCLGTSELLDLFARKEQLSMDEMIVGLYRLYKVEKTRTWLTSTLYNLIRKNLVKKVKGSKSEFTRGDLWVKKKQSIISTRSGYL